MSKFLDYTGLSYLIGKFKKVAFTGSYNDLSDKPTIPAKVVVDSALSSTSTNPVQNKVINSALATKITSSEVLPIVSSGGYVTSSYVSSATVASAGIATKLGTAPIGGANNPVYISGGTAKAGNTFVPNTGGTFSGALRVGGKFYLDIGYTYASDPSFSKGKTPSETNYIYQLLATDAQGESAAYRLGAYQVYVTSSGTVCNEISTYPNISGNSTQGAAICVWQPKSGTGYVTIPYARPDEGDSSTKVPDTAWVHGATVASAGSAGTITSTLPVSKGGTGRTGFSNLNGILTVANTSAGDLTAVATAAGALYATATNGVCQFGTLPVAQGGTGATTLASAGIITSAGAQTITGEKTYAAGELNFTATSAYLKKTLSVASNSFPSGANYLATRIMCSGGTTTMAGMSQWWTSDNTGISISVFNPRNTTQYTVSLRQHSNASCYFEPTTAGILLGRNAAGYKWQQLIASTTTIATSDERYKSNIKAIPDNILDAWGGIQWRQYQLNDAIKEKGEGKARLHTGVIAQHVSGAFAEKGIDITRYGLFCHDEWPAEPEEKDDLGNVIAPAREASDDFAIRYEEALCMEAAYQRRRADRLEERVKKLEEAFAFSQNTNQ